VCPIAAIRDRCNHVGMEDTSVSERDQLLRQRIAVMTPDDFEQLLFELVRKEEPAARRIVAPDAGADVLRPQTDERPAKVWQAKRYPKTINWEECRESLVTAIAHWSPSEVVFMFPRDLSQTLEKSFKENLVEHPNAVACDVKADYWNLSDMVRRLAEHPDLRVRFFGAEQESTWEALNRTIRAGGGLESAEDLVNRARALGEWAEKQDKKFTQAVTTSALEAPAPAWDRLPYMTLEIADSSARVNIASWPREGAAVEVPMFSFYDNETGRRARIAAVERLARGEPAEITQGARVQMDAPQIMRALTPAEGMQNSTFIISPGDPITLEIVVSTDEGEVTRSVDLFTVPPPPGATGALAGYAGAVLIQASIRLLDPPRVSIELGLSGRFTDNDIRANADAAELLDALYRHSEVTLRSEVLFPSGEVTEALGQEHVTDEEKLTELRVLRDLFGSLAYINDYLGIELAPPLKVSPEDMNVLLTIVKILETREGTAEFNQMTGMVDKPQEIAWLAERASGSLERRLVTYEVFGREVTLGMGVYELPRLKVVDIIPYGQAPDSPARVVLAADGDPTIPFRLE